MSNPYTAPILALLFVAVSVLWWLGFGGPWPDTFRGGWLFGAWSFTQALLVLGWLEWNDRNKQEYVSRHLYDQVVDGYDTLFYENKRLKEELNRVRTPHVKRDPCWRA